MLKDTDFEFPKKESKLDRVWIEWNNLTNDKQKRRYCDELEEMIKDLEDELDSKNKEVAQLINSRKKLGVYWGCFHNYFNFCCYQNFRFKLS
tara:strand:+ start:115 stop:390 length:276 start_codon:yes stop_codon:yes gene_type:complete